MSQPTHYTSLILGSGQSGTPLASHLHTTLSHSVCVIERSHIGGCCVNEGCTPTKTMVASGRVAHLAWRAAHYGVHVGSVKEVRVDMQRVRERKRDIVKSFREGGEGRLKGSGVDVLMGEARFTGPKTVSVKLNGTGEEKSLSADYVFINTGERPSRPDLPGLGGLEKQYGERVLDSTSIQELGEVPEHLIVLGGGVIGLEFGQLFRRFGAKVTIVQRGKQLLPREDKDVVECMQDILREDGIDILLNTSAVSISFSSSKEEQEPISLTIKPAAGSEKTIKGSHILLATGRTPNTSTLDLPRAGIKTNSRGHILVSPTCESNIEGVYAIGDVHGGPAFTHVSYDDFRIIRDNFTKEGPKKESVLHTMDERENITPYVVYTDPQLAHVGLHASELESSVRSKALTASIPLTWVARALETDETRGLLKATVDGESGKILGFTSIGPEAGELMAVVQMAMMGGLGYQVLQDGIFAHPSWAESLNNLWGTLKEVEG